jgi:hypothetical protein
MYLIGMPKPFLQRFLLPNNKEITSIVMDEDDFNDFVDSLRGIIVLNNTERAAQIQIDAIKAAKTLPMISRGTKTQFVFDKYGIETDFASFIVRGQGQAILDELSHNND